MCMSSSLSQKAVLHAFSHLAERRSYVTRHHSHTVPDIGGTAPAKAFEAKTETKT